MADPNRLLQSAESGHRRLGAGSYSDKRYSDRRAWLLTAPDHTGPHRVTHLLTYLHLAYSHLSQAQFQWS